VLTVSAIDRICILNGKGSRCFLDESALNAYRKADGILFKN